MWLPVVILKKYFSLGKAEKCFFFCDLHLVFRIWIYRKRLRRITLYIQPPNTNYQLPNTNYKFSNLYFSPVFRFFESTLFIIYSIVLLFPNNIKSSFALVIPVYNIFRVSNIGIPFGTHIITTSNSLPLRFMYCYCITML